MLRQKGLQFGQALLLRLFRHRPSVERKAADIVLALRQRRRIGILEAGTVTRMYVPATAQRPPSDRVRYFDRGQKFPGLVANSDKCSCHPRCSAPPKPLPLVGACHE